VGHSAHARSSRWRFLNPMETLKAIYEALGTPYPRLSFIAVFFICGVLGIGIWWFVGTQVAKDRLTKPAPSVNTTTGPQSPIMPNNGGNVTITNDGAAAAQSPPPKDKPK
jgi:hypothetical protein